MRYYQSTKEKEAREKKRVEQELKKKLEGTLKRKALRKKKSDPESVHFRHVVKQYVEGHEYNLVSCGVVSDGYFKCPLCGKRVKRFVEVIREDGVRIHIGTDCLKVVGLEIVLRPDRFIQTPNERGTCWNEKEFQQIIKETARKQKLLMNVNMMKRRPREITDQDLVELLDDL